MRGLLSLSYLEVINIAISDKCKEYRKWFKSEMEYLVECSKLSHSDEEYISPQEIEEILDETPEYNMTERSKNNIRKKLK